MSAGVMLFVGGVVVGVLFLVVLLMGLRILPGGLVWHKRLGIIAMILALLHALGGILNLLGLLPF